MLLSIQLFYLIHLSSFLGPLYIKKQENVKKGFPGQSTEAFFLIAWKLKKYILIHMLTKNDLEQIGKIIKAETEPLKKQLDEQGKGIKTLQKDSRKIRKDVKAMLDFLNKEDVRLLRRVERLEEHIGLPRPE